MDKAYVDFERLYKITGNKGFFVTRAKDNMAFRPVYSSKVDKTTGLTCDQKIKLTGYKSKRHYMEQVIMLFAVKYGWQFVHI